MAKITRITQNLFGSTAGTNQIAQFGSLAAGSPAFTTDPAVVQSLSNFLTGWFGASVGSNSPAEEDMNALFFLAFRQLAYLMQEGIAEYDAGTTYFIGSICQDGIGNIYTSKTNNNIGNPLTNITNWKASQAIGALPLGSVIATFPNMGPNAYTTTASSAADADGFVLCQGQTIVDATSPLNGYVVPTIHNGVFLRGNIASSSGTTGGADTATLTTTQLPGHTHGFTSTDSFSLSNHIHNMNHGHQIFYIDNTNLVYAQQSNDGNKDVWTTSGTGVEQFIVSNSSIQIGSSQTAAFVTGSFPGAYYTSGPTSPPSGGPVSANTGLPTINANVTGTTGSTGTGSAFSILPTYVQTVYLMRIK